MLYEDVLCRGGPALHPVDDNDVRPRFHGQRSIVVWPSRAALHVNRFFPSRYFTQLLYLDRQIVGPRPIGMPASRSLIDSFRQRPHVRDALGDLLAEQHAASARLCSLPDNDFDRISLPEIIRIHSVSGRQILIDELTRMLPFFRRHSPVAGRGACADFARAATERLLRVRRKRSEAHAGDGYWNLEFYRLARETRSERHVGAAFLPVSFKRIARHRCALHDQVIEVRKPPFGSESANSINSRSGRAADVVDRVPIEAVGLAQAPVFSRHSALNIRRHY